MTTSRDDLLSTLQRDWPEAWSEELTGEVRAFLENRPASLPAVRSDAVRWATTAPDHRSLRFATEDVRAWLVPTFAIEDGIRTVGSATGVFGERLLQCSAAGYLAWRCASSQIPTVLSKLKTLRELLEKRPKAGCKHSRSLLELRRRFETALAGGDRTSAGEIIEDLAQSGSESASNVLFMRVCMWDRFREYEEIVHPRPGQDAGEHSAAQRSPHRPRESPLLAGSSSARGS